MVATETFTKEQFQQAILITNKQYCLLENPQFVGQTPVDENNQYKMYWVEYGVLYYTINSL